MINRASKLRKLALFSLEKTLLKRKLKQPFNNPGDSEEDKARHFAGVHGGNMRSRVHQQEQRRFQRGVGRTIFTVMVAKQ